MNNTGFYKKDETQILFAPNIVEGQGYTLLIGEKDSYSYPVDGWVYADSLDAAIAYFASNNNNQIALFDVQPENITLGLSENDRNSFSQMLSLVKEALDLGLITNDSPQIISDINGEKHQISTLRFRQIMVQYGMYYKGLWDQLTN